MPDATSLNASSSPLATLLAVGGTGVSAQTGVQGAATTELAPPLGPQPPLIRPSRRNPTHFRRC
jgi:hypothetical protein